LSSVSDKKKRFYNIDTEATSSSVTASIAASVPASKPASVPASEPASKATSIGGCQNGQEGDDESEKEFHFEKLKMNRKRPNLFQSLACYPYPVT
jgi:hypothetical protein